MSAFAKAQSAQALLKEVDAKVKSYDNITIDFKYALSNEAEGVNQETKGYTQKMDITQKVGGRQIQFVKLTPIDSNSDVKESLLGIDAQTKHIHKLIITQKNGTKIMITVNSFKPNLPLAKNVFTFDKAKYTDYYINKL